MVLFTDKIWSEDAGKFSALWQEVGHTHLTVASSFSETMLSTVSYVKGHLGVRSLRKFKTIIVETGKETYFPPTPPHPWALLTIV